MAKKKMKIKINGTDISGSYNALKDLETVYTLAAIQQREMGHLTVHERLMDIAISIGHQLLDQLGDMGIEKFD